MLSLFAMSLLFACSDAADPMTEEFVNEFSFTIDGTNYSYDSTDIMITQDPNGAGEERLFLRVDDGDLIFTYNAKLTHDPGTYGLDWNEGEFFFMDLPQGRFYFLDTQACTMTITKNDITAGEFEATFKGQGSQAIGSDTVEVTNGIIRIKY